MIATHGNPVTHHGTCEVCGRGTVALRESRHADRRAGRKLYVCSNEFDCFAAWQARQ
jgi:hypothetical protein